ncbi:MAG TPA: TonB-dependent receptor [Thermoanaerobaculia bacterium]|nr:TonB-dependent receptor [Thermoanaerobaculia bacterium]
MIRRYLVLFALSAGWAATLFGQSIPLSTLTGKVTTGDTAIPGVSVTVTSPNLQGSRTTITTDAGDYIFPLLPAGEYKVNFELAGMRPVSRSLTLTAARTDRLDVALQQSNVSESITVTAETPIAAAIESTQVSTNFKQDLIEQLPVQRNLAAVTLLAPGVNSKGPGGGIIISGAMSYDTVYMVNGAVVNENLRGQPHSLFIEDAIQETTILTGGVSAEYGHFTGGVVSAVTKSGGNDFSGSFRTNATSESWVSRTPFTADQGDTINPIYEATLGGPFLRDHLWFFGAGRLANTQDIRQTVPGRARAGDQDANGVPLAIGTILTPISYPHTTDETRLEGKLTGSIARRHTFVASYMDIAASETNQTGQSIMDLDSLVKSRETPNTFLVGNYNGVLTDRFFIEGQYSKKDFAFVGSGSTFYDIVKGTLVTDRARGTRYWSPTFRNTPEGEERDIQVYTAKATYFLSTANLGSHEFRVGYEDFNEVRAVNNYQNGSDYRISAPSTIVRGTQVFPSFPGGASGTATRISWLPIFVLSQGSDYTTRSTYIQDRWNLNDRWTFNLGARYDKNDAISGAGTFKIADDAAISPRLSAHYDLFGNGKLVFNTSYNHNVGRLAEGAANDADPAGRTATLQWNYRGPSINTTLNVPTSQLIPTDQAVKMVMDWFFANGGTDRRPFRTTPSVPGVETILDVDGLKSPMVKEMTFGVGSLIGTRGFARADLVLRNFDNFYSAYRTVSNGQVSDRFGTKYDLSYIRSDNDVYDREYTGVQTQVRYRLMDRLNLGGNYTWSRLVGNVIGEDSGSGPLVGVAGEYPEYRQASWNYPTGYLTGDQRHRARVYASYDLPTPIGGFNISVLQNFDSGTRTSLDGVIDSRPYVTNPGYLTPPTTVGYFFGERGNLKTDDITRTDLAINYKLKLVRGIELFVQPELINVFNEQGVESFNEEVLTAVDAATTFKAFNPFTETPKECPQGAAAAECQAMGANFQRGPNFGKPTRAGDYQLARTFRVSVGLRF